MGLFCHPPACLQAGPALYALPLLSRRSRYPALHYAVPRNPSARCSAVCRRNRLYSSARPPRRMLRGRCRPTAAAAVRARVARPFAAAHALTLAAMCRATTAASRLYARVPCSLTKVEAWCRALPCSRAHTVPAACLPAFRWPSYRPNVLAVHATLSAAPLSVPNRDRARARSSGPLGFAAARA